MQCKRPERFSKNFDTIVPRGRIEYGSIRRLGDLSRGIGYEFLIEDSVVQFAPPSRL